MQGLLTIWRSTAHLWLLVGLLVAGAAGFYFLRDRMIPETYGQHGPYRAAAMTEIAARPSLLPADANCLTCHANVGDERADSRHKAVRCFHCHGVGNEHMAQAAKAAKTTGISLPPAKHWDGDFHTRMDLFVTKDKAICLSCHESVVGMAKAFKKIDSKAHLEEMSASEPASRESCFECHGPHNTAP